MRDFDLPAERISPPSAASFPRPTETALPVQAHAARPDDPDDPKEEGIEEDRPHYPKGSSRGAGDVGAAAGAAAGAGLGIGVIIAIVLVVSGCCVVTVGGVVVALVVPAVAKVRDAAARTQSTNNLKQI